MFDEKQLEASALLQLERKRELIEGYRRLNQFALKRQTVFAGSSLMERFPVYEIKQSLGYEKVIYNRGIGGYTTEDYIKYLDVCIFDLDPSELYINIGTNDMARPGFTVEKLKRNYSCILDEISQKTRDCKVTMMAYYPINDVDSFPETCVPIKFTTRNNATIQSCNDMVKALASEYGHRFVDVNSVLLDRFGKLKQEYSIEGLHMWPDAYLAIFKELLNYF